jgi:hypothetical protein
MECRSAHAPEYSVLCGLRGNRAQLEYLQVVLSEQHDALSRHFLVDNRDLRVPPSLTEIASMVRLASAFGGRCKDVSVAWVSRHDCRFAPSSTLQLPVRFHHFRSLDRAKSWLRDRC